MTLFSEVRSVPLFLRGFAAQKQLDAISEVNVQLSAARIAALK